MRKKIPVFILMFLFITSMIVFTIPDARAGVKVTPGKLIINMPDGFPTNDIHYDIRVTNPYSFDIQAKSKVIHPYSLSRNYVRIPDLSWVEVVPEKQVIPARSSEEFEMFIDVPDGEQSLHFNESWEIWILVIPKSFRSAGGDNQMGMTIQTRLAAKVLINTPPEENKMAFPQNLYIFLIPIIGFVVLFIVLLFMKKKKNMQRSRAAIYYIKNRKSKTDSGET